jgi:thiol:disulfide interchange protein
MERTETLPTSKSQRAIPIVLLIVAAALLIARIAMHFMTPGEALSNDLVRWVSLEDAGRMAVSSRKPILIDFTAEWCAPCHMLDAEVFRNAAMAKAINARFVAVRVIDRKREDGRNEPMIAQLQQRYVVNGFPTVVFVDASGIERARMEGYRGREQFQRVMESVR